jgi:lipoprotein-releasing system permease protein
VVIGVEMAKGLNVKVGDKVRLISPMLEVLTPIGPAPKSLGFRVVAIFSSKMYEYDARFAYVSLPSARRFLETEPDAVSGLQLRCTDPERTDRIGALALAPLSGGDARFEALDWKRRNQTLFSALKLERVVAFVVLVFIILVASFSIVNTLTMSVIEKRREIAILKTMGAHDVGIMKLFLVQGLLVGAFGTAIGGGLGVGTMKLLERFGFWIPGEVYYIDSLPVKLEPANVALVVAAALLIVWDFAVFPALRGSRLQPVEGLRDG